MKTAGLEAVPNRQGSSFVPPTREHVTNAAMCISEQISKPKLDNKVREATKRALAGVRILQRVLGAGVQLPDEQERTNLGQDLAVLFGKEWDDICEQLIGNSYLPSVHFLPPDGQAPEYSGVPEPSLVLLRYPITVSAEILYRANDVTFCDWDRGLEDLRQVCPAAGYAFNRRPMKRSTLRRPFIGDLIARYVALNSRVGAPSLTKAKVRQLIADIRRFV